MSALGTKATETEVLSSQLANTITLVAKEDQIVWTIFGIFWAANLLLLGALFVTGKSPEQPVAIILSTVGVALCFVWSVVQSRALRFLRFYEGVQKSLEEVLLKGRLEFALSPSLSDRFDRVPGINVPARRVMMASSVMSAVLWAAGAAWFLVAG